MSIYWCNHNCCEVYEVNTEHNCFKCKLTDDMVDVLPCECCDDFEERNEEEFE